MASNTAADLLANIMDESDDSSSDEKESGESSPAEQERAVAVAAAVMNEESKSGKPKTEEVTDFPTPDLNESLGSSSQNENMARLEVADDVKSQDDVPQRTDSEEVLGIRKNMRSLASTFVTTNNHLDSLLLETASEPKTSSDVAAFPTDEVVKEERRPAPLRQTVSRATKIYQSFTAGLTNSDKSLFGNGITGTDNTTLRQRRRDDENEKISEGEKERIMQIIEQEEDSSDEDLSSEESGEEQTSRQLAAAQADKDGDDISGESDILNRSLRSSDEEDSGKVLDPENYLRYISEKYNASLDVLEIVDKNERSFKQVAEKMIQQSSQLETQLERTQESDKLPQRKLMHSRIFKQISDKFHGDDLVSQGVPYAVAALEDFIAIGSSDGSVRLFDHSEQEITILRDRRIKDSAVTCLDMKRIGKEKHIYIGAGHMKGQVVLYKVEGLLEQSEFIARQNSDNPFIKAQDNLFGNLRPKHCKTVDDKHITTICSLKFMGDLTDQTQIISGDIQGNVYLSEFKGTLLGTKVSVQCLMQRRLGATFSLAPLIYSLNRSRLDGNQAYLEVMQRLDGNIYATEKEKELQMLKLAKEQGSEIVGFGSLDEIYVAQIKPSALPLLSIRRPPYIPPGTIPYLDWGFALTPTFRDQSYPVLAMAWGKTIQLGVYHNQKLVNEGVDDPKIELDGFYICEASSIDQCFFLSESLLFILVNKKEVRILYTQNFTPGVFSPTYQAKTSRGRKVGADAFAEEEQAEILDFTRIKSQYAGEVGNYAEKDKGYRLMEEEIRHKDNNTMMEENQLKSKFNFTQTVCKNYDYNVVALGKQSIGSRNLIHWEEFLDLIRRMHPDDWLKVLRAALDIYCGRMTGLAGLPDQREKREVMLRERMKDLLKENIDACIQEFQEGACVSHTTLRVATEFCIRVGAIDHLFGELFEMFAEAGMEQRYFQNLDAFILSGKLKSVIIPEHILQRLLEFYRQTDVELLEKAILNLNLTNYPHAVQVRHICEEEYLSSALIHLLTTLFDDDKSNDASTCIGILCSLFNLMMRNQTVKTREDVVKLPFYIESQGTSIFESQNFNKSSSQLSSGLDSTAMSTEQANYKENRRIKLEIEHSRVYISYKLLWVTGLFIEGKKFPSGSLSSFKWRCYIYDIVRFLTNEKFMVYFLNFDPFSFLRLVKKLFLEQEPYEYIRTQLSFIEMYKDTVIGLEPCLSHEQIVACLDHAVSNMIAKYHEDILTEPNGHVKAESLQNAFNFFVTAVSKKLKIRISTDLCVRTISKQISFHKNLLMLPKEELTKLIPESQQSTTSSKRVTNSRTHNIYTYLVRRNERDIIGLVRRHQSDFDQEMITKLVGEAETAPLFKLRVLLQQLLGDFQKCLALFFQIKSIKEDVFAWLDQIQNSLKKNSVEKEDSETDTAEKKKSSRKISHQGDASDQEMGDEFGLLERKGVPYQITLDKMKELIKEKIGDFVQMDPKQAVKLCDQWFDSDYNTIASLLKDQKDLSFAFLSTVVSQNEENIVIECENSGVMLGYRPTEKFFNLLLQFVEVLCHKRHKGKIVDFISRSYFPIEASLKICEERGALEACAVLYKRNGDYQKAVSLYVSVLVDLGTDIVHTLFDVMFQDMDRSNEQIQKFDEVLASIVKICEKQSSRETNHNEQEALWKHALLSIFGIKERVYASIIKGKDNENESANSDSDDDDDDIGIEERNNFRRFLSTRNQGFIREMSEFVNLHKVVLYLEEENYFMEYNEFKQTFKEKVRQESMMEDILQTSKLVFSKEMQRDFGNLMDHRSMGVVNDASRCDYCHHKFNFSKWDRQEVWLFKCDHIYHLSCVQETKYQCSVCFNEVEAFCKSMAIHPTKCFSNPVQYSPESILLTKKQSSAVKRANRRSSSRSTVASKESITSSVHQYLGVEDPTQTPPDIVDLQHRQSSSQAIGAYSSSGSAGPPYSLYATKQERQMQLMLMYEKSQKTEKLELSNFIITDDTKTTNPL